MYGKYDLFIFEFSLEVIIVAILEGYFRRVFVSHQSKVNPMPRTTRPLKALA